jgi:hypothetical protein
MSSIFGGGWNYLGAQTRRQERPSAAAPPPSGRGRRHPQRTWARTAPKRRYAARAARCRCVRRRQPRAAAYSDSMRRARCQSRFFWAGSGRRAMGVRCTRASEYRPSYSIGRSRNVVGDLAVGGNRGGTGRKKRKWDALESGAVLGFAGTLAVWGNIAYAARAAIAVRSNDPALAGPSAPI